MCAFWVWIIQKFMHILCFFVIYINIVLVHRQGIIDNYWRFFMSRTKIVILRMKQLIYAAIFIGLGILLLLLLFFLLIPDGKDQSAMKENTKKPAVYEVGVYESQMTLGEDVVKLKVSLDEDRVKSVELKDVNETVSAMYPLMKPAVEEISNQLATGISVDEVVLSKEGQYTEKMILSAVDEVVDKHRVKEE